VGVLLVVLLIEMMQGVVAEYLFFREADSFNKFVVRKIFAPFRFGVATPLYPKATLCEVFRIQRRYSSHTH
jgi:hypothetical protein